MSSILRKLQLIRNKINRQKPQPDAITEEKWTADFSKEKQARFNIKSDSSYDANLRKNLFSSGYSLALALKKTGCISWIEAPDHKYRDVVISGSMRVDSRGGYGAGGINFRMVDDSTYYSLLVSSKGYFRLDALRNGMPLPLVGWTELPLTSGAALNPDQSIDFTIIAYGSHIIILIRGRWAAEVSDSSIIEGTISLAAASYQAGEKDYKGGRNLNEVKESAYTTEVFLESLFVESRIEEVTAFYEIWRETRDIDPKARLHLAETFTAMNQHNAALVQLQKGWAVPGHKKNQAELLLAGRLALVLGLMADAESYIGQCFESNVETPEGKQALIEMTKILYTGKRYKELKSFCAEALKIKGDDPVLFTFQGHAFWNLDDQKNAVSSYDKAFELDRENGIIAKNAANAYEVMGRKKEALLRYIDAAKVFMKAGNYNDLGQLVPKLLSLGGNDWEARSLAGKWAFGVEDWKLAEEEFAKAETLRKAKRPKPKKDGAQLFLQALLLIRAGKRQEAIAFLEDAAALEKDYALFHFRLAENLFLLENKFDDPKMLEELNAAILLSEKEEASADGLYGWINNFAAQIALGRGNLDDAAKYLEKASEILGDLPAVRVNRGVLFFLQGSLDEALQLLDGNKQDDPEGIMANCAGNLLVRSNRFEDADAQYRKALSVQGDNIEYLCNRASCLMEMNLFGEADDVLAKAHSIKPSPAILEMIGYVAIKKSEFKRAEQACLSALEMDPDHVPSLLSLGWIMLTLNRHEECEAIVRRIEKLEMPENSARGLEELRKKLEEFLYKIVECDSCERNWKISKNPPSVPALRFFAMPPDHLPAGSCTVCGKTLCIGCAKKNLDSAGRFICPSCNRPLKIINEGLKKILHDWAVNDGLLKQASAKKTKAKKDVKQTGEKRKRGRPKKE